MAEEKSLAGWPKKRLVRDVRRHLWHYGIRPKGEAWRAAWAWASAIAHSYYHTHWPMPSEIATQYILLLLTEMKGSCSLKLPYRANKVIPDEVRRLLPSSQLPLLEDASAKRKEAPATEAMTPPLIEGDAEC